MLSFLFYTFSLHAFTGNDAAHIADRMGRLLYTVAYAATAHGLNQTPEANILRGTANALSDIAASPAALETQRAAILADAEHTLAGCACLAIVAHEEQVVWLVAISLSLIRHLAVIEELIV